MKDINGTIQYQDFLYSLVFDLNVMEAIQEEYGSLEKWGDLTDGATGEPDAKAVIFGFMQMINEGIEIYNEENDADWPLKTHKQIGRMITEVGLQNATHMLNKTVIDSTQSAEKN